jgi:hypothetical protein
VRKKLSEAGIEIKKKGHDEFKALKRKVETMRERGLSYQSIADSFNLWRVATRTDGGQWHPKTVREIEVKTLSP